MFCPGCGSNIEDGARFCGSCGCELPSRPEGDNGRVGVSADAGFAAQQQPTPNSDGARPSESQPGAYNPPSAPATPPAAPTPADEPKKGKKTAARVFTAILIVIVAAGIRVGVRTLSHNAASTSGSGATAAQSASSKGSADAAGGASGFSGLKATLEEYEEGIVVGDVYYNPSCGLKFSLPEEWRFQTKDEIDERNGKRESTPADFRRLKYESKVAAASPGGTQVFTWDVASHDRSSSSQGFQSFSASEVASHREDLEKEEGIADIVVELGTVTVAGAEAPCLRASYTQDGIAAYETQVVYIQGSKAINMGVFCAYEDNVQNVFNSIGKTSRSEVLSLAPSSGSAGSSGSAVSSAESIKAPWVGEWELVEMGGANAVGSDDVAAAKEAGMTVVLSLRADGTLTLSASDEAREGTWSPSSETRATITIEGGNASMTLDGGQLTMNDGETKFTFVKVA